MDELRKALETFALRNAEGEVSDAMLEKACEAYKVRSSEFVDDYQYNLYVAKSVYDHLHGVDQDPEISKAIMPGQTKVVESKGKYGVPRNLTTSVVGGAASRYIDRKRPSELIPFRGEFPMLNDIDAREFRKAIQETLTLDELSPLFQKVATEGQRIALMEQGFKEYLAKRAVTPADFVKLSNADKSDYLLDWMNTNSISVEALKITIPYGKYYIR